MTQEFGWILICAVKKTSKVYTSVSMWQRIICNYSYGRNKIDFKVRAAFSVLMKVFKLLYDLFFNNL